MNNYIKRRNFLKTILASPTLATAGTLLTAQQLQAKDKIKKAAGSKLRISLNAYSFNEPLRNGSMTLDDLLDFCAANDFDAVDLTAYYFPGYPAVPEDSYIFHLKQKAHRLGLDISGTGVKNDFTNPHKSKRKQDVKLIKKWIECAAKIGAPVIRIFSGTEIPAGHLWDEVATWMVKDMKECVAYGEKYGVIVASAKS
jgi:sugar phosphate isomerase/epimerase